MALLFLVISLLCTAGVKSEQFQLRPESVVVLTGSEARFNASLKGKWQIMVWEVRKLLVLTINEKTGPIPSSEQYSATNYSTGSTSRWEFTIHNVSRNDSGPVVCTIQGQVGERRAKLDVQESGTVDILGGNSTAVQDEEVEFQCVTSGWFPEPTVNWSRNGQDVETGLFNTTTQSHGGTFNSTSILKFTAARNTTVECLVTIPALLRPLSSSVRLVVVPKPTDWTVLIAVVVSIGGFALLVLLIIGIVFCCKRRKERQRGYQDEMRVRTQSQINRENSSGKRRGQANLGYEKDGPTSVPPSEFGDSSSQTNGSNICEIPDIIRNNQEENSHRRAHHTLDGSGVRKHRHVTIV